MISKHKNSTIIAPPPLHDVCLSGGKRRSKQKITLLLLLLVFSLSSFVLLLSITNVNCDIVVYRKRNDSLIVSGVDASFISLKASSLEPEKKQQQHDDDVRQKLTTTSSNSLLSGESSVNASSGRIGTQPNLAGSMGKPAEYRNENKKEKIEKKGKKRISVEEDETPESGLKTATNTTNNSTKQPYLGGQTNTSASRLTASNTKTTLPTKQQTAAEAEAANLKSAILIRVKRARKSPARYHLAQRPKPTTTTSTTTSTTESPPTGTSGGGKPAGVEQADEVSESGDGEGGGASVEEGGQEMDEEEVASASSASSSSSRKEKNGNSGRARDEEKEGEEQEEGEQEQEEQNEKQSSADNDDVDENRDEAGDKGSQVETTRSRSELSPPSSNAKAGGGTSKATIASSSGKNAARLAGKQLETVGSSSSSGGTAGKIATQKLSGDSNKQNRQVTKSSGKQNNENKQPPAASKVPGGGTRKTLNNPSSMASPQQDDATRKELKVGAEATTNNITDYVKSKKKHPLLRLMFIKPKNDTICIKEAYLEFPRDLIGNKWRSRGLVIIHISVVCYMFYSLALICERYFMPSLEEFAQRLQLSEDVAGATLMSAGSSAPELFTAILGVFIAKGDVGTGAIVGSAVFNILFVIGVCAFVSTTTAQLDWWPVLRDSVFYTFTVLVLILFIYDERVTAYESFTMIALYGVYILIMVHNEWVRDQVTQRLLMNPMTAKLISSVASVEGPDDVFGSCSSGSVHHHQQQQQQLRGGVQKNYQTTSMTSQQQFNNNNNNKSIEDDSMFLAACLVIVQHKRLFRSQLRFQSAARYIIVKRQHRLQLSANRTTTTTALSPAAVNLKGSNEVNYFGPDFDGIGSNSGRSTTGSEHKGRIEAYTKSVNLSKTKFSIVSKDDYEFWNRPPEEGENYYLWLAKIPVNYVLHYTTPDCTLYPDKYMFTFFISIAWTAFFSYIMVWMVTLIGFTLGIPDSVMGFTFLAAGTSIPDCYSSIHAARNGMANMAVSNSIGSNVFDILIGLSLPWFIQTAIYPGVIATINSRGVIYSVILLFLSLIVTIYLMNQYEWTLKPRLGLALLIAYGLFIMLTCMLEFNLFGHVNPPPCPIL